jgi:hypothetical protein
MFIYIKELRPLLNEERADMNRMRRETNEEEEEEEEEDKRNAIDRESENMRP